MSSSACFVLSAASAADFPTTGLPEIALVGRSNVGKSSLINGLAKHAVARTSAAPGKTRLANYYLFETPARSRSPSKLYLVDLPGYGYARGGDWSVREFEALTTQYFNLPPGSHRRIAGVLHLIDSRHPGLPQDDSAHEWVAATGIPIVVLATKIDKLGRADLARSLKVLENGYDTAIIPVSSAKGDGLDEVWKTIHRWLDAPRTLNPEP